MNNSSAQAGNSPDQKLWKVGAALAVAVLASWLDVPQKPAVPTGVAETTRAERIARVIEVLAITTLLAVIATVAMHALISWLLEDDGLRFYISVGAGLTAITLITAFKDVLLSLQKFYLYVISHAQVDLFPEYVKYAATAMAVAASIFAVTLQAKAEVPVDPKPVPTVFVPAPEELTRPVLLSVSQPRAEYFPFLFELADGPPKWAKGVSLNPSQLTDVQALANTLKACVGALAGQDVIVEVVGYADANDFPDAAKLNASSAELNRQTANLRAEELGRKLETAIGAASGPSRVIIERIVKWPESDADAMTRSERYFRALPLKDTDGKDQGLFNRRAEVVLLQAGVCDRHVAR